MGTFIVRPLALDSGGTPLGDSSAPAPNASGWGTVPPNTVIDALQAITLFPSFLRAYTWSDAVPTLRTFGDTLRVNAIGASIYLDGSPTPVDVNTLPAGFTVLSAAVICNTSGIFTAGGDLDSPAEHCRVYLQKGTGVEALAGNALNAFFINQFNYSIPVTMLDLVNDGFGVRVDLASTQAVPVQPANTVTIYDLRIEGTYESVSFSWTLETPDTPPAAGDEITITSNPKADDPLILDEITEIDITYYDPSDTPVTITITSFTRVGRHFLSFILPDIEESPIIIIEAVGNGTQFSGSIALGKLVTIWFIDGTGIYRLVVGKRNDTLYVQDLDPVQTIDVRIPPPFAKTGFLP